jgi:hypothetical protein
MTKFSGKAQILTFNAMAFGGGDGCITSVEYSDDIDDYVSECAGATAANHNRRRCERRLHDCDLVARGIADQRY